MNTRLEEVFSYPNLFGPAATDYIVDPLVLGQIYSSCKPDAPLTFRSPIVGRRGSGKTTYLKHISRSYSVDVELRPDIAFAAILRRIERLSKPASYPETIAQFWLALFSCALLVKLAKRDGPRLPELLDQVVETVGGHETNASSYDILHRAISAVTEQQMGGDLSPDESIYNLRIGGTPFEMIHSDLERYMKENHLTAAVLMDNLEEYHLDRDNSQRALSGLLRCQAVLDQLGGRFRFHYSIPSEVYGMMKDISFNPLKDFGSRLVLDWTAGELMFIVAQRVKNYVRWNYENVYNKIADLNPTRRMEAAEIIGLTFPETIKTVSGSERTIAYMLRHTQLLPRHVVVILNGISARRQRPGDIRFTAEEIRNGVDDVAGMICDDVIRGYRVVYPELWQVVARCVPNLPITFRRGTLHRVYNHYGRSAGGPTEYSDFERMLLDTGLVGIVESSTGLYATGRFGYNAVTSIYAGDKDLLCLHPLVSRTFDARFEHETLDGAFGVFPFGSGLEREGISTSKV